MVCGVSQHVLHDMLLALVPVWHCFRLIHRVCLVVSCYLFIYCVYYVLNYLPIAVNQILAGVIFGRFLLLILTLNPNSHRSAELLSVS